MFTRAATSTLKTQPFPDGTTLADILESLDRLGQIGVVEIDGRRLSWQSLDDLTLPDGWDYASQED